MAPNSPSLRRRFLQVIAFVVSTTFFTLLLVEAGTRRLVPQHLTYGVLPNFYVPDESIGWRRAPNLHIRTQREGAVVEFCTDGLGDRISCGKPTPTGCTGHVLVVGDSFVEALYVPYDETVWARISADTGSCVHVAGAGGWAPSQYLALTRERLARNDISLDLLIVNLYSGNDFLFRPQEIPGAESVRRPPFRLLPTGLSWGALREWVHPYAQVLESHSHAWVVLHNRFIGYEWDRFVHRALRPSIFTPAVADVNLEVLGELVSLARTRGVPVLITLTPISKQVLDPTGSDLVAVVPEVADDLDMDLPSLRMSPRIAALPGVRFVDLLPGLRARAGPDHYLANDSHFNARGHALWYALIQPDVAELLAPAPD